MADGRVLISRSALRRAAVGASAANLALLLIWDVLFRHADPDSFYLFITRRDFVAATLNIAGAGTVVAVVGWLAERSGRAWVARVVDAVAVAGTMAVLNVLRQYLRLTPNDAGEWASALGRNGTLAVLTALSVVGGAAWWRWRRRVMRGLSLAFLALSPFVAITLGRAAWICATDDFATRFASRRAEAPFANADRPGRRVVLVVFDELDYRLAFPARPAWLDLPTFDSLGRESLVAEHAEPPARNTNEALPSYLIGRRVASTASIDTRTARLVLADSGGSLSTDSVATLFRRARALGANSAMIGWNLPFCRSGLSDGLVRCAWWPSGAALGVHEGLGWTMLHQWVSVSPVNSRAIHRVRHEQMMAAAQALIADPSLDLVVLHLIPPHYPWIFNANARRYMLMGFGLRGYMRNLALADEALREVRNAVRASGRERTTTLIVTSDHPFRKSVELDGAADPRVPLFVRLGEGGGADTVRTPLNTVFLGDLIIAALAGAVRDRAALARWFGAHATRTGMAVPVGAR